MPMTIPYKRWGAFLLAFLLLASASAIAGERSTGQVIDDAVITTKIKSSLAADAQVSALAVNVDTSNGIVSLTGVVDNELQRQRAIQLAQETEGVKRVNGNNLRVKQ